MKDQIITNLDNPAELEKLYRSDKAAYKRAFNDLYPAVDNNTNKLLSFWNERLNFSKEEISWGNRQDLIFIILAALFAGFIAKVPELFSIDEEFFYPRNIGFIVFPALTAFFAWKNKLKAGRVAGMGAVMLASLLFINWLPGVNTSNTSVLSCIHLVLVLWAILGFAFAGDAVDRTEKRLAYLKYNGDAVVMSGLILAAGAIMTAVTIGLFKLIGFGIEKFYFQYVGIFGLAAAPILGTYLTQTNPQLVGKVSPVIAKIFSPLVLIMLVIYLGAILYSRKDPYNDREFLLVFNALLVGVMAIIFFSVAEAGARAKSSTATWILFLLSIVTIIVNGVALSAIIYRVADGGFTPNRAAVLGSNLLILGNLLLVTVALYKAIAHKAGTAAVGKVIARYLPLYVVWAAVVTFIFPLLFAFK